MQCSVQVCLWAEVLWLAIGAQQLFFLVEAYQLSTYFHFHSVSQRYYVARPDSVVGAREAA